MKEANDNDNHNYRSMDRDGDALASHPDDQGNQANGSSRRRDKDSKKRRQELRSRAYKEVAEAEAADALASTRRTALRALEDEEGAADNNHRAGYRPPSSPQNDNNSIHHTTSWPTTVPTTSPTTTGTSSSYNYRGFSTSIGDMFLHPQHERVDCCALTCCGMFQSDRDRFLLQGVRPPSPCKRVWVHALIPLGMFLMAGYIALNVYDRYLNEMLCLVFLFLLVFSILLQCQKGRTKRMDIRKDVLWFKYQLIQHHRDQERHDNHRSNAPSSPALEHILHTPRNRHEEDATYYYRGQTDRDIGCSHPLCFLVGCYPTDQPGPAMLCSAGGDAQVEASLCSVLYRTLCGPCCGMYWQCGGVCGMAQESREIETALLPPAYRRVDYVTMEPMMKYYPEIYNQRWRLFHTNHTAGPEGPRAIGPFQNLGVNLVRHWQWPQLSQLSITILRGWVLSSLLLGIWSVVGPTFWTQFMNGEGRRHFFSLGDFIVYMASWVVSLMTLAVVVHLCQKHKPLELSMDAMIKYFCSGFVLSSTLAIFYELALGLTVRLGMLVFMAFSGISVVEDKDGYTSTMSYWIKQPLLSMGFGGTSIDGAGRSAAVVTAAADLDAEDYLPVFGRDHPFFYSVYLFLVAYVIAALTEEICKYFGFRMMEHPDFFNQKDLEDAARAGVMDDNSDDSSEEDHNGRNNNNNNNNSTSRRSNTSRPESPVPQQQNQRQDFPHHGQSLQARGSAITVAMICVAMGFALCEDLIHIFLYNGQSVGIETYVLVARTLFPIHPIAAALQSIGVCERDVERMPTRFGRILLPAILFHGTYDFLLLWVDFLVSLKRSDGYHDNDDEALEVGSHAVIASYAISAVVMGAALFWFFKKSKAQSERLAALDANQGEQQQHYVQA